MKHINIRARTPEGALLRLLDICAPRDIATAVDLFIERLDALAGDPDLEPDGDELDGSAAEDDFVNHSASWTHGPGCPVADPDEDDDPLEANGDELDTGDAEDETLTDGASRWGQYCNGGAAGCAISDPAGDRDRDADAGGLCPTFGIDQTRAVGLVEAFHDLNGIPWGGRRRVSGNWVSA